MLERRDFLRLLGFAGLALVVPPIELETPMELSDIWLKIANNAQLTPQEKDFLARQGRETQQRNAFIAGNTSADGKLNVTMPFFLAYNEKLATAKANVTVPIPSGYNHLMILTSVKTDDVASRGLYMYCNGDTGNNYQSQVSLFTTSSILGVNLATNHLVVGYGTTTSNTTAGSVAFVNNYSGSWYKNCVLMNSIPAAATHQTGLMSSMWLNTSPIQSLKFYLEAGNIVADSIISVYCIL